jgi:hypothetical protein
MSPVAGTAYKHLRLYPNIAKAVRRAWLGDLFGLEMSYVMLEGGNELNREGCTWVGFNGLLKDLSTFVSAVTSVQSPAAPKRGYDPRGLGNMGRSLV